VASGGGASAHGGYRRRIVQLYRWRRRRPSRRIAWRLNVSRSMAAAQRRQAIGMRQSLAGGGIGGGAAGSVAAASPGISGAVAH